MQHNISLLPKGCREILQPLLVQSFVQDSYLVQCKDPEKSKNEKYFRKSTLILAFLLYLDAFLKIEDNLQQKDAR
jgi:hypothetical protein